MRQYFYRLITNQDQSPMGRIVQGGLHGLSVIYRLGIQTILWCYQIGLLKKKRLSKSVISVGNITWGGTGKTPLVEWILKYLKEKKIKPAVLIRGYMGKNSVILRPKAEESQRNAWDSSALSGLQNDSSDEAQVLQQSFPDVPVLVGRDRIENARRALEEHPVDLFVLDDGFQHWKLERDLDIVVIDSMNPFGNGCLIPRGILREPLKSLARADLFVLTKTDWGQENVAAMKDRLRSINPATPVIETVHRATALVDFCNPSAKESLGFLKGKTVVAFCGIGQPDSFMRLLGSLGADVALLQVFGDHHPYNQKDVASLLDVCRGKKVRILITTQKDVVKLEPFLSLFKDRVQLLTLKIEIQITKGYEEFCGRISRLLDR